VNGALGNASNHNFGDNYSNNIKKTAGNWNHYILPQLFVANHTYLLVCFQYNKTIKTKTYKN